LGGLLPLLFSQCRAAFGLFSFISVRVGLLLLLVGGLRVGVYLLLNLRVMLADFAA
jgi:hypothetical protein